MSRFRVFVLFVFLFVLLSAFSSLSADDVSICPSELTVEMLANPLGIDMQAPRLGWKCAGTREGYGFEQSAYRIVAASTTDRLDDDTPDLWDSGWVESSESIQIPYDGKKLSSDTKVFSCSGSLRVSETFTVQEFGHAVHGNLNMSEAFLRSCNTFFASLALELGDSALRSEAEKFAFNRNFLFRDIVVYNSRYPSSSQSPETLAASGYGQSSLLATPMHLCLISAAVANGGQMPEPRLLKQVTNSAGTRLLSFSSAPAGTVCSRNVADRLSEMMKSVVQGGGSGFRAQVPTLDVRGKTGTAVSTADGRQVNYGWFTGFNAQKDLPVAVCILVEDIADGETGGTTAALVARDVFSWFRSHPDVISR